jgi:prepilin-type processing-associated H-X9-DG protein
VSDSIQDWVQPGDAPRIAGAKTDYYLGLNPPYNCKEAPMDDLSELLLVKGIWDHPEIYWGGAATNHPGASFQHPARFWERGRGAQLSLRPGGPVHALFLRKININTADANVLQLLPGVDANAAASILKFRAGPDGVDGTEDDTPFQNPSASLPPPALIPRPAAQSGRFCDVRSTTFKVTVTARIGNYTRDFSAILFRPAGGRLVEVVSFYWKCSADEDHTDATNFTTDFNNSKISYFVSLDASSAYPQMLLSGDDNFEIGGIPVKSGLLEISKSTSIAWTAARHKFAGNILAADGSVQMLNNPILTNWTHQNGGATNRLAIP